MKLSDIHARNVKVFRIAARSTLTALRILIACGILFLLIHYITSLMLALGWFFVACAVFITVTMGIEFAKKAYTDSRIGAKNEYGLRDEHTGRIKWSIVAIETIMFPIVSIYFWGVPMGLGAILIYFYR